MFCSLAKASDFSCYFLCILVPSIKDSLQGWMAELLLVQVVQLWPRLIWFPGQLGLPEELIPSSAGGLILTFNLEENQSRTAPQTS